MAKSDQASVLVRELLVRELDTVSAYSDMVASARTPAVRELLERITRQEKHHIAEAVDMLARLDSGQATALETAGVKVGREPEQKAPAPAGRVGYLPSGMQVDVAEGETVLAAAMRAGVDLRHDCGGRGRCGTCRVEVTAGSLTPVTGPERTLIGESLDAGWRLACQARPVGAVQVRVPASKRSSEGKE